MAAHHPDRVVADRIAAQQDESADSRRALDELEARFAEPLRPLPETLARYREHLEDLTRTAAQWRAQADEMLADGIAISAPVAAFLSRAEARRDRHAASVERLARRIGT